MIKWVLRGAIDYVERNWNDPASRLRDTIDASPCVACLVSRASGLLAAALVGGMGLAATVAAQGSGQPATVRGYTPERMVASVAAVVGLIGAVIGGMALARSRRTA